MRLENAMSALARRKLLDEMSRYRLEQVIDREPHLSALVMPVLENLDDSAKWLKRAQEELSDLWNAEFWRS